MVSILYTINSNHNFKTVILMKPNHELQEFNIFTDTLTLSISTKAEYDE